MKAISIRQPWSHAILHMGKRCENRDWFCKYRGPILIHAAKGMSVQEYQHFSFFWEYDFPGHGIGQTYPKLPSAEALERGGIVGKAVVIDCIGKKDQVPAGKDKLWSEQWVAPWFFGRFGIILDKVEALPFIPYKGALGLFEVPDDVVSATA